MSEIRLSINKTLSINKALLLFIVLFSLIPDIGLKLTTFGFTWTAYRFIVYAGVLILLILNKGRIVLKNNTMFFKWFCFLGYWVLYGTMLLFVKSYVDFHAGFLEILSISNGFFVFYIVNSLIYSTRVYRRTISLIFLLLNFLVLFGLTEIVTGLHWTTSFFKDPSSSAFSYANTHMATGLMYNINDFSTMLTILSSILVDTQLGLIRYITLLGVVIINIVNHATTCNLAIMIFVFYRFFLMDSLSGKKLHLKKVIAFLVLLLVLFCVFNLGTNSNEILLLVGDIKNHLSNFSNSTGSLFSRVTIYLDSIYVWITYAFFGLGPGSFSNFFIEYNSLSGLINPHALIFEVLVEYGIITTLWFVYLAYKMFSIAKERYYSCLNDNLKNEYLKIVSFIIVFSISSFAPSSFIGYAYPWLLWALMCYPLDNSME